MLDEIHDTFSRRNYLMRIERFLKIFNVIRVIMLIPSISRRSMIAIKSSFGTCIDVRHRDVSMYTK